MKHLILFLCLIFMLGCKTESSQIQQLAQARIDSKIQNPTFPMNSFEGPVYKSQPYEIELDLKKLENNAFDLVINMKLNNGSYYVSPNSKRDFKGIFTLKLENNEMLEQISKLMETPLSVEEFDPHPFVNGNVNWVKVNTTYKQQYTIKSNKEFEVFGLIQFTIEPRCTLEKIPFVLTYKNGKMNVQLDNC